MVCQRKISKPDAYPGLSPRKSIRPYVNLKLIIFTLVGVGFLLGAGWRLTSRSLHDLTNINRLTARNKIVTGTVISKRGVLSTFGMDYTVLYRYQLAEQGADSITARSRVSRKFFQNAGPNSWIAVYYAPERPEISMLDLSFNQNKSLYLPGFIAGPLLMLAGMAVFPCLLSKKNRHRLKEVLKKNS